MEKLFKKKKFLALVVFMVMCVINSPVFAKEFSDVTPDDPNYGYAYSYISAIGDRNITTGCGDGTMYCPYNNVTREQMAAFIIRAIEGEPTNYDPNPHFSDVPSNHWAFKYVQRIYERGIASGYGGNIYGLGNPVTREQMAKMIVMAMVSQGRITEPPTDYCSGGSPFSDVSSDRWSCRYVKKLKELGITTGYSDGTFRPESPVDRAQMATFIGRAFLGLKNETRQPLQGISYVVQYNEKLESIYDFTSFIGGTGLVAMPSLKLPKFPSISSSKISVLEKTALSKIAPLLKKIPKLKAPETYTEACSGGGSMTFSGDFTDTSFDMTLTANNCVEENVTLNGQLHIWGSQTAFNAEWGANNQPFTVSSPDGSVKILLSFSYSNVSFTTTSMSFTATANGYIESTSREEYVKATYNNFKTDWSLSLGTPEVFDIVINGNISEESNINYGKVYGYNENFNNLRMKFTDTGQYMFVEFYGTFSINVSPPNVCVDGTYTFQTLTPIKYDYNSDRYLEGKIKVNDADIVFNSDGSVTVIAGGSTETYSNYDFQHVPGICFL